MDVMLTYDELLKKCALLEKENAALKAELAELKGEPVRVVTEQSTKLSANTVAVNMSSTAADKIKLFRSLFAGREDVFAKRWYSKTTEKGGYQPVCKNEWDKILCEKKKFKCNVCPNRALLPLTDGDIYAHLAGKDPYGRDVIGVYPMLLDETVNFCCLDFDDEGFETAAKAFLLACSKNNIPAYVERSRSGKGAHILTT